MNIKGELLDAKELKQKFEKDGFIILENLINKELIDKYVNVWLSENADKPHGWTDENEPGFSGTAYLDHPEILDILCSKEIGEILVAINKAVALHVDITYSISTEFGWHQDNNMPKEKAGDNYVGVWVALEDVSPDAGPFEFVPGSHKWDLDWQYYWENSANSVTGIELEAEMVKRSAQPVKFLAKKGDVFIWHSRLMHRGADIVDKSKTRMSLIGHYCNDYANMDDHDDIPEAEEIIDHMLSVTEKYAQWGGRGAMYFVNPD